MGLIVTDVRLGSKAAKSVKKSVTIVHVRFAKSVHS
jgi:hypothetical protein